MAEDVFEISEVVWADFAENGPWPGPVLAHVHGDELDDEGHVPIQAPDGTVHFLGVGDGEGDTGRTFWAI